MTTSEDKIQPLLTENKDLRNHIENLIVEISCLKEKNAWFERQMFGKRSERVVDSATLETVQFLPGMQPSQEEPCESEKVEAHQRKKKRKPKNDYTNGLLIPEDLPVEQTILDLSLDF